MSVHDLEREEPRQFVLWERIWRLCWTQTRLQHDMGKPAVLPVGLEGAGLGAEPAQSSAEGWTWEKGLGKTQKGLRACRKGCRGMIEGALNRVGCSVGAGMVA